MLRPAMRATPHRLFLGKESHKFSVAHMTVMPDGSKERMHGHNYQVAVAVALRDVSFDNFLHFDVFKRALEAQCKEWDEHLLLPEKNRHLEVVRHDATEIEFRLAKKRYVLPADEVILLPVENVVVETLSQEFCRRLVARLGAALRPELCASVEVTVSETPGQGGSYYLAIA
jgi:6-pyruvoyltetrahydropterin/6-carboxytetrahydropterin synthase